MEIFTERLIRKNPDTKDIILAAAVFAAGLIISAMALMFLGMVAIIIIAAVFYGVYFLLSSILVVEYEYILTNNSLDIDKISGKSKRTRLKSIDIKELSRIYPGTDKANEALYYCAGKNVEGLYTLVYENKGKTENIVINPNDSMLKAFEFYLGLRFER